MVLPVVITNGKGVESAVTDDKELLTSVSTYPAKREQKVKPFRQYLTDDGLAAGTNDMGVDGSSTNVGYFIPADETDDRYLANLSFIVGYGTSGQPNQFADAAALTNGIRIFYESSRGQIDIHDGIKTNQDFFRVSFQLIPTDWEVRHVNNNNDYGYFIPMDLTKIIPPYGIKLDAGSSQKLGVSIRDDATNADSLNCIAYGFDRFD